MTDLVLVTGGFGYVGGRIAQWLMDQGLRVRLASRRPESAAPSWLPAAEVCSLRLDVEDELRAACQGARYVVHLAAPNEIDSAREPERALIDTAIGTFRALGAARQAGAERFIYFSTIHAYGRPLSGQISECTLPRPVHPYAIAHRAAEDYVLAAREPGFLPLVVRLSNAVGYPAHLGINRWTLVANDLCRQAAVERKITLRSSGMQYRDFIPMADVCRAVLHLVHLPESMCGDGLFNLGGDRSLRILDLAALIQRRCAEVLGFTPPLTRVPSDVDEPELEYRIDRLQRTGFRLRETIETEIDGTLWLCRDGGPGNPAPGTTRPAARGE